MKIDISAIRLYSERAYSSRRSFSSTRISNGVTGGTRPSPSDNPQLPKGLSQASRGLLPPPPPQGGNATGFNQSFFGGLDNGRLGDRLSIHRPPPPPPPPRAGGKAGEVEKSSTIKPSKDDPQNMKEVNIEVLKRFLKEMTGQDIKEISLDKVSMQRSQSSSYSQSAVAISKGDSAGNVVARAYSYQEKYYESEKVSFSASGVVKTADGKEINISISIKMSREFMRETNVRYVEGRKVQDPLVINYGGNAADLGNRNFAFDLNMDSTKEMLPTLSSGSGFLALDKNGDGKINNGGEMFGASTGNGFGELAKYDEDGNQFIDEADPVFSKLSILSTSPDGTVSLSGLLEKGVGAIYLDSIDSPFSIKDKNNELQGEVARSGIYVGEDGGTGSVQQVNLAL